MVIIAEPLAALLHSIKAPDAGDEGYRVEDQDKMRENHLSLPDAR
jgi:hypothetical protein